MIICYGNKIHDLDYDVIWHWIHLKTSSTFLNLTWANMHVKSTELAEKVAAY